MTTPSDVLPSGWTEALIRDLCDINPKHSKDLPDDLEVSFVPMAAVSAESGSIVDPEVRTLGQVRKGYTHFADRDVILAKITPCMENGKSANVIGMVNGLACGTTEFFVLRSRGGLDPSFLHSFLRQQSFRTSARAQMQSGVGQARVPKEFVQNSSIPVPPISEQRRIANAIKTLQVRSRNAQSALEEADTLIDRLGQSILHNAFSGALTTNWRAVNPEIEPAAELLKRIRGERRDRWEAAEMAKFEKKGKAAPNNWRSKYQEPESANGAELPDLPPGWCWAALGEAFDVRVGATPSRKEASYWDGGTVPWVSSGEVSFCRIADTREAITAIGLARTSTVLHPPGTVLLGMIGEGKTRGQAAILDIEACTNQNAAAIRVSETEIPPEYVYQYLRYVYDATRRVGSGNNQQALNKSRVQAMTIPLPPIEEQKQICDAMSKALATVDSLRASCALGQAELGNLDEAVLVKAFRGELVPQDPGDEPASELLARVAEASSVS